MFRRAKKIVTPSQGLKREIADVYPDVANRLVVISNPVDIDHYRRPERFDRVHARRSLHIPTNQLVLAFTALGHFERKGLPLLLKALRACEDVHLIVVGGDEGTLAKERQGVKKMGLSGRVRFVGMKKDVRPYLWAADAFVFPSYYEVFSLSCLEAAAAGLPIIAPLINGLEEFLVDGRNGCVIEHSVESIGDGVRRLAALSDEERLGLGAQAARDVEQYSEAAFVEHWRSLYHSLENGRRCGSKSDPLASTN
jgi:glycosyltransferase involved in cell wall biosynthesis